MDSLGSFISGAVAGIVGLGIASWLVVTLTDNDADNSERGEE